MNTIACHNCKGIGGTGDPLKLVTCSHCLGYGFSDDKNSEIWKKIKKSNDQLKQGDT